jgi:hypothetical protein
MFFWLIKQSRKVLQQNQEENSILYLYTMIHIDCTTSHCDLLSSCWGLSNKCCQNLGVFLVSLQTNTNFLPFNQHTHHFCCVSISFLEMIDWLVSRNSRFVSWVWNKSLHHLHIIVHYRHKVQSACTLLKRKQIGQANTLQSVDDKLFSCFQTENETNNKKPENNHNKSKRRDMTVSYSISIIQFIFMNQHLHKFNKLVR